MTESEIFDEFERLWRNYRQCCAAAAELNSSNAVDDEFIKMAIVGFSFHQRTDEWHSRHYELVKGFLDEYDQPDDTVELKKFAMLGHGALLGLYSAGKIDDRVYRLGYILLPGFIMGKGGAIDSLKSGQAKGARAPRRKR
jgi:hypothetical protein